MLQERIAQLTKQHGSLRAAARVLGCSPSYLMRLRDGTKTNPSDALLRRLKLRRVVTVQFVPYNTSVTTMAEAALRGMNK